MVAQLMIHLEPFYTLTHPQPFYNVKTLCQEALSWVQRKAQAEQRQYPFLDALYKFKISNILPPNPDLACSVKIQAPHFSIIDGLLYFDQSLETNEKSFWQPNVCGDIKQYVQSCANCAFCKNGLQYLAPLESILSPDKPWDMIAIDLLTLLTCLNCNKSLLYCVCFPYLINKVL